jgi:hypothetical protein
MKKWLLGVMSVLVAVGLVGCDMNDQQVKVISQNAGLAAAVTWIAYDNPDTNAVNVVSGIVDVIATQVVNVQTGMTYTAVIYPEVQKLVAGNTISAQYKPIALAGSLAVLNGIDLLIAANPSWETTEGRVLLAAQSFCVGAKQGLALTAKDPLMIRARAFAVERAKVVK